MLDHTSLRAWQEAHVVSLGVIRLSRDSWKPYAAALFGQLQRSSLSVELNIAEGYSFGNTPTYTRHLGVAYGSAVETVELLRLGIEAGVIPEGTGATLLDRARGACRLLVGLLKRRRRFPA
jgi:four helix bundle protein